MMLGKNMIHLIEKSQSEKTNKLIMADELKNPLTSILGFSELLLREPHENLNENQKNSINHINKSANKLLKLINQVLAKSSFQENDLILNIKELDIC